MSASSDKTRTDYCLGYYNLASRKPKKQVGRPSPADYPVIVPCPYCTESVIASGGRYREAEGTEHRHQPQGAGKFKLFVDHS